MHKGIKQRSEDVTQTQQQRLESPAVTLTLHACKYKAHKLHQWYILSTTSVRTYLWWSLYTLYLHACQVRIAVNDSGLCCCVCGTSFKCYLTPFVDSAGALWA